MVEAGMIQKRIEMFIIATLFVCALKCTSGVYQSKLLRLLMRCTPVS